MAFGDNNLKAMAEVYHAMHMYMNYSFTDIGMMTPLEREVLMGQFIRDKDQELREMQQNKKGR